MSYNACVKDLASYAKARLKRWVFKSRQKDVVFVEAWMDHRSWQTMPYIPESRLFRCGKIAGRPGPPGGPRAPILYSPVLLKALPACSKILAPPLDTRLRHC